MAQNFCNPAVQHVFVLMLENRSFDHMLGFSGITGTDAVTGQPTSVNGLSGSESNSYNGVNYAVTQPADYVMPYDPGHEFPDAVTQLCGAGASYPSGGNYPAINNSGFVYDYATTKSSGEGGATGNFGEIMKCYSSSSQLPVMNALATQFAVCDNWFSSLPGPTWPNRFFLHAASSGGLDHSPSTKEMIEWETVHGYSFPKGSIYDLLDKFHKTNRGWRLYRGVKHPIAGSIPGVSALKGIQLWDTHEYEDFHHDVNHHFPYSYIFIEPNYGDITNNSYSGGQSQHPMDDVRGGEALIKSVYETIRNSPLWESSMLIITYDEHGGFYDHAAPPAAVPPGDTNPNSKYNQYGFTFAQYGVRVPAIVVSPYTPANIIDHRLYDHSSVAATLETIFGMTPLTARDAAANNLTSLASLATARTDTPTTLPDPAQVSAGEIAMQKAKQESLAVASESIDGGNLASFLQVVIKSEMAMNGLADAEAVSTASQRFAAIQTRAGAKAYLEDILPKLYAYKPGNGNGNQ